MLYDPRLVHQPDAALFDTARWRSLGALTAADRGRGGAWFLRPQAAQATSAPAPGQEWVLRHYLRGGVVARWVADRYLWRGEEGTRPFRELRLTAALHAAGLPVPQPVAARYERDGWTYRADLLTVRIPDAVPLSRHLAEWPSAVWPAVGACLQRFHAAGAWHADLNAHNILVTGGLPAAAATPQVWVIDWDRGRLLNPVQRSRKAFRGNLLRLQRSLQKLALEAGWRANDATAAWSALEAAYAGG